MKSFVFGVMFAIMVVGCGESDEDPSGNSETVCQKAAKVIEACPLDASSIRNAECKDNNEVYSQCVLDHKDAVCTGLADPSNMSNTFNECISKLAAA